MAFKVKITKSLTLKTLIPDMQKEFTDNKDIIARAVSVYIEKGRSPVAGKAWRGRASRYNKQYSDKYKGGRARPIDMTLSGDMLKELDAEVTSRKGNFRLTFGNNPTAAYHNDLGAGKSKIVRRLLPSKPGESFAIGLNKLILKIANNSANYATKKQK
jgi:hypothetical protein